MRTWRNQVYFKTPGREKINFFGSLISFRLYENQEYIVGEQVMSLIKAFFIHENRNDIKRMSWDSDDQFYPLRAYIFVII